MADTAYRFATVADAQRELEAAWQRHQGRLAGGTDLAESRAAYYVEFDAIMVAAVDPAGRDVVLEEV